MIRFFNKKCFHFISSSLFFPDIARNENIYFVNKLNFKSARLQILRFTIAQSTNPGICPPRFTMVLISLLHMECSPWGLDPCDTHLFLMQVPASPSAGFRIKALSKKKKKELDLDSFFPMVNWVDRYTWHLSKYRIED